jgi:hypothetical protein
MGNRLCLVYYSASTALSSHKDSIIDTLFSLRAVTKVDDFRQTAGAPTILAERIGQAHCAHNRAKRFTLTECELGE